LWRNGQTFPKDAADLDQLFANGEVDFTISQDKGGITSAVEAGKLPKTSKLFLFDAGTIADYNYVGIPYNAANKAAALVLANALLEPKLQIQMASPKTIGFGLGIDPNKLRASDKTGLEKVLVAGAYTLPPNVLASKAIGDLVAEYDKRVQDGFKSIILGQ
jgi:putative spermidine/putrescine transport system substrate-binding protein